MKHKLARLMITLATVLALGAVFTACDDGTVPTPTPQPTTYTVTYDLDGGQGTLPTESAKAAGAKFNLAASTGLTKTGYTFDKWNDGTTDYAAGAEYTMPEKNVTIKAVWKAETPAHTTYTVTFDPNNDDVSFNNTVNEGDTVEKPATDPVHPQGKIFRYWRNDDTSSEYDFDTPVNGNLSLSAVYAWKVAFEVGEGATGIVEPEWVNMWTARGITLPDGTGMTNGDKVFGGWTDGTNNYNGGDVFVGTGNHTLTAIWNDATVDPPTPPATTKYNVTVVKASREDWISNISGEVPVIENKAENEKFTVDISALSYPHYSVTKLIVKHYVTTSDGGEWLELTRVNVGEQITMPAENVQIAPVWTANKITVTFDANGGTGSMASIQRDYNSNYTTTGTAFENKFTPPEGGSFIGWATTSDGDPLANNTKFNDSIVSSSDTVTLYAIWHITEPSAVTIADLTGNWSDGTNTLVISSQHPANEIAVGSGILNGKYYVNVFIAEGVVQISNINYYYSEYDIAYNLTINDTALVLSDANTNATVMTLTSKTAVVDSPASDFAGKWERNGTSQPWVIAAEKAYYGSALTSATAQIIGNNIVLFYGESVYYYVLSKSDSALTGYFSAQEKDFVSVTFNAGSFTLLTVAGTPNQIVASGSAPDSAKIKVPSAPEGKEFSKWVIAGTETEFDVTAVMTSDVSIEPMWADKATDLIIFVGSCKTPTRTIFGTTVGGETYVTFKLDTNKNQITYLTSDGTEKTVSYTDSSSSSYKPDTYGADAVYLSVKMENVSYYILVKADNTKLWLCNSDDEPLESGEFSVQSAGSQWKTILTGEGSEIYTLATNGTNMYFATPITVSGTEFLGIQFNKNSIGLTLKTIYMSNGAESVLKTSIQYEKVSDENPNWLVFSSSSYVIVLGQKTDGKFYIVSLKYKTETNTEEHVLSETKPE